MGTAIRSWTIFEMRRPEHDALTVAIAVALRLDAILANRSLLIALNASFATCQTARLRSFARKFGLQRGLGLAGISTLRG